MNADVCVIGSGFAGSILASALAERGIRVVILEAGGTSFFEAKRDVFTTSGPERYPLNGTRVRTIGGTSMRWTATAPRLHPDDFQMRTRYGAAADWPITYEELEPYYVLAERALGVYGARDNLVLPRSADYPLAPPRAMAVAQARELYRKAGVATAVLPKAITTARYQGRPAGSVYRVRPFQLRRALSTGRVQLIADAVVRRLEVNGAGQVNRAVYQGLRTPERAVEADLFVVACGGVESPRLLLLSASNRFPRGLANGSGLVGAYFMEHPWVSLERPFRDGRFPGFHIMHSWQWYDHGRRPDRVAMLMELRGGVPVWEIERFAAETGLWGEPFRRKLEATAGHSLRVLTLVEELPRRSSRVELDPQVTDVFGDPAPRIHYERDPATWSAMQEAAAITEAATEPSCRGTPFRDDGVASHHIGTCRMGDDPSASVVNRDLRAHEVSNLYVVGSANFVTSGAANPTPTLVALVFRLAEHLLRRRSAMRRPARRTVIGALPRLSAPLRLAG